MSELVTLRHLLEQGTNIGAIATAIEQLGIWGWDRFGRFGLVSDAYKAGALDILALEHHWQVWHEPGISPLEQALGEEIDVFSSFGWRTDRLPDFAALETGLDTRPQTSAHARSAATKARDTVLLVVAGLMREAGIEAGRGAAVRLCEAVDRVGASMSQDTARQLLKDMDEALQRRGH